MRRTLNSIRKRISVRRHDGDEDYHDGPGNVGPLVFDDHRQRPGHLHDLINSVVQESGQQRRSLAEVDDPLEQAGPGSDEPLALGVTAPLNAPFPNEIFYLIIDHLSTDTLSLLRLSRAIPSLRHQCWTYAFHSVPVTVREREAQSRKKKLTSNVDLFLQLVTNNPKILRYIRGVYIQDLGRYNYQQVLKPTSEQDLATLAMLLVQSQRMPNLRSFKIQCSIHWITLPKPLQAAFLTLFQSPSLEEVLLADIALPVNMLGMIPNLRAVDIQTGGVRLGIPVIHPMISVGPQKQIETLKIRDRNLFGQAVSTLGFSDGRARPFSLAHLKRLEICLPGNRMSTIQPGISLCASLECLKVFVGTAGGLPQPIDLSPLPGLKSLTLSADVTYINEADNRFHWLIEVLSTLPNEPIVEDITILMRIDTLLRGRQCDWDKLDEIFSDKEKWSTLRCIDIVWCTGRREDLRQDLNQDFINDLPLLMPNLSERRILKVQTTYSDAYYNFWTFM